MGMGDYTDTGLYPGFTTKKAQLRWLRQQIEPFCPNAIDILFRMNNSEQASQADGDTIHNPNNGDF